MENYIDGFVLPIPTKYIVEYQKVAEEVAEIWKEYGATAYMEYVGNDLILEGTTSFTEAVDAKEDESIIFGGVVFPSKEIRDLANKKVPSDPRMTELVLSLTDPDKLIFDGSRMVYGGFQPLVQSNE